MGEILGQYFEVVRELGRGAKGVVYLALDSRNGRQVALKVFPSVSSKEEAEQIQNEFFLLSSLHGPSLAEVLELIFDEKEKKYFLLEEYCEGETLSKWSTRLSFEELVRVAAQLCQALQFLHQQEIFHGDLKPNNVLIHGDKLKVVDFGLSSHFIDFRGKKNTVAGTVPYMAPELFLEGSLDGRADLYALGATLCELISGKPPFEAATLEGLVEKHLFETPVNPVTEDSPYPKEFGFLILKLLSKDPSDRFHDANDVIRAINLRFGFKFPLGPEKEVSLSWSEQELKDHHVARLEEQAVRFYDGKDDPESRRILAEIRYRQGQWDEAEKLLNGLNEIRAELLKLQILLKKGSFEAAALRAKELLLLRVADRHQALLYNILGTSEYYLGHYPESEAHFRKALTCYMRSEDQAAYASLLNNLGNLKVRAKKWGEAMSLYQESIDLCRKNGDAVQEGLFLMSLGYAFHLRNDMEEALLHYRKSETLLEAIGYRAGLAKVKSNLANLFLAMGSLEKSEEKLRESQALAQEKGDRFLIAYSCLLEGDLFRQQGKKSQALEAYQKGKQLFQVLKNPQEEAAADKNIAELLGQDEKHSNIPTDIDNESLLKRIFKINQQIGLLRDENPILQIIMDSMIEFTGAERGLIILKEEGVNQVKLARNLDHTTISPHEKGFSAQVVEKVMEIAEPLVTTDAMSDERFTSSLSIHKMQVKSVVCIPFRVREAVIGVIYLDNRVHEGRFSQETINLLQSFADQAAIAITNFWVFEELKQTAWKLAKAEDALQESKKEVERLKGG